MPNENSNTPQTSTAKVDLFVDAAAAYPKTLLPFPKDYYLTVPSDKYSPLTKVGANIKILEIYG